MHEKLKEYLQSQNEVSKKEHARKMKLIGAEKAFHVSQLLRAMLVYVATYFEKGDSYQGRVREAIQYFEDTEEEGAISKRPDFEFDEEMCLEKFKLILTEKWTLPQNIDDVVEQLVACYVYFGVLSWDGMEISPAVNERFGLVLMQLSYLVGMFTQRVRLQAGFHKDRTRKSTQTAKSNALKNKEPYLKLFKEKYDEGKGLKKYAVAKKIVRDMEKERQKVVDAQTVVKWLEQAGYYPKT